MDMADNGAPEVGEAVETQDGRGIVLDVRYGHEVENSFETPDDFVDWRARVEHTYGGVDNYMELTVAYDGALCRGTRTATEEWRTPSGCESGGTWQVASRGNATG